MGGVRIPVLVGIDCLNELHQLLSILFNLPEVYNVYRDVVLLESLSELVENLIILLQGTPNENHYPLTVILVLSVFQSELKLKSAQAPRQQACVRRT